MDGMKTSVTSNAKKNQIDEVSNETTFDSHEVPANSISNLDETSSTGKTNGTFVAHNTLFFFSIILFFALTGCD